MKESEIQRKCFDYLAKDGFFVWRNHVGGVKQAGGKFFSKNPNSGSPDIFALKNGLFFCLEIKTPIGKLSPHQASWLAKARSHGAVTAVIRSLNDLQLVIDSAMRDPKGKSFPFDLSH